MSFQRIDGPQSVEKLSSVRARARTHTDTQRLTRAQPKSLAQYSAHFQPQLSVPAVIMCAGGAVLPNYTDMVAILEIDLLKLFTKCKGIS